MRFLDRELLRVNALSVANVLEGTVRRDGTHVRVSNNWLFLPVDAALHRKDDAIEEARRAVPVALSTERYHL